MSLFGLFHSEISIAVTVIVDFLYSVFAAPPLSSHCVCGSEWRGSSLKITTTASSSLLL